MDDHRLDVLIRRRTARGHLNAIVRMVEHDAGCIDIMKQLSAVHGMLEGASRAALRHHLETHVAAAVRAGQPEEIVDELDAQVRQAGPTTRPRA